MTRLYVSNKDETVRMFKSDFFESLSRVHWTVPIYVFMPVVLAGFYFAIFEYQLSVTDILVYFILGLFIWTITEYLLHRFIFHFPAKSNFGKKIHFIFHGVHHDYPRDSKRLVMPPSVSLPLAAIFFFLFKLILGNILLAPFFSGFILGYLFYDITHYAVHHFNMKNKFWLALKNHHMIHHYKHSDKGFGVSQPTWDYVFGTTYPENSKIDE